MDRLNVIRQMTAHPEYCLLEHAWGDLTLEAARKAIEEIVEEEADDYFVVLLSDANLDQYSIGAADLAELINLHPRVHVYILFIGTLGDQAEKFMGEVGDVVFFEFGK
jgi:hypothetical protein